MSATNLLFVSRAKRSSKSEYVNQQPTYRSGYNDNNDASLLNEYALNRESIRHSTLVSRRHRAHRLTPSFRSARHSLPPSTNRFKHLDCRVCYDTQTRPSTNDESIKEQAYVLGHSPHACDVRDQELNYTIERSESRTQASRCTISSTSHDIHRYTIATTCVETLELSQSITSYRSSSSYVTYD